ncbi:hypothetical protein PO909_013943 [Leuciscus waleckii]
MASGHLEQLFSSDFASGPTLDIKWKQDGGEPCISNTLDPSLFQPSLPHTGPAFLKVSQSSCQPAC